MTTLCDCCGAACGGEDLHPAQDERGPIMLCTNCWAFMQDHGFLQEQEDGTHLLVPGA